MALTLRHEIFFLPLLKHKVRINDSQNGGFFGTRIPNPREGEKNSFPRAKPEEKEFFYLPEGLEFLFQKNPPFWETDSNNYY